MPLWRIYHPEGTFLSPTHKSSLASSITSLYTAAGLPAFYVVVLFIPLPSENIFIGGQTRPPPPPLDSVSNKHTNLLIPSNLPQSGAPPSQAPFVRVFASNIARKLPDGEYKAGFRQRVDAALDAWIRGYGYDWEWHADETDRELWQIQGFVPPATGSEAEGAWRRENRPVGSVL
ncbi:hypothetical protein LTS18_012736 [Coniosporium uncinatum]|uniref:Uncharacterized protein n=1 Tax=Coniosporium uncinatum TaxID=93489 RepID=A0ACC3DJ88_9PEZI|nr:hypothetical protein LTS18_012736 [Coniosporium uncinatum]